MQNFANYFAEFTNGAIALRLLLAAVLGCVIGLERATKHHPAGMRTFALVCIGAAASAVVIVDNGNPWNYVGIRNAGGQSDDVCTDHCHNVRNCQSQSCAGAVQSLHWSVYGN